MLILQDVLLAAYTTAWSLPIVEAVVPLGNSPWYCELMPWLKMCR